MAAMRIATNGRAVARVTAELALSRVTGEYLAGFAFDLNPIERERVAREIDRDLNERNQTRSYERERAAVRLDDVFTTHRETTAVVRIPLSNDHNGKLVTYSLEAHEGHTHVEFTLAIHQRDAETN